MAEWLPTATGQKPNNPRNWNWIKPTFLRRTERRLATATITAVAPNTWVISGEDSLGDHYPEYTVTQDGKKHICSCSQHPGGEYRKFCTHAYAVILAKYDGKVDTYVEREEKEETEDIVDVVVETIRTRADSPTEESPPRPRPATPTTWDINTVPLPAGIPSLYPTQINAINQIMEAFQDVDLVVLDGPTGSGKSFIGWAVANLLDKGTTAYLCADKALQDQFLGDFGPLGARTVKGRANYDPQIPYHTEVDGSLTPVTCADCDFRQGDCTYCTTPAHCSYRVAKEEAATAPVAILNYAYFLREVMSPRTRFAHRNLVIADECDVMEGQLLSFGEVVYGRRLRQRLQLGQPKKLDDETGDTYVEWLIDVVKPALEREKTRLSKQGGTGPKARRRIGAIATKISETDQLIEEIPFGAWVLDGYKKGGPRIKEGHMIFRPVMVNNIGRSKLFKHGDKWLLMSATPINPDLLVRDLGWEGDYRAIHTPMPIPAGNRKIYPASMGAMTRKEQDATFPTMIKGISAILDASPSERAIIHTVSYRLTQQILEALPSVRPVFTYTNTTDKEHVMDEFLNTYGAVLIGPSIGRGTDFRDDRARINIIAKIPYGNLGDKRVAKRMHSKKGDEWYSTQTVRELVQMCGRTTRGVNDFSVTYILDAKFYDLYNRWHGLFPEWWREALDQSVNRRKILSGNIPPVTERETNV